ncbi:hypothetical protein ABZ260_01360 [Streptosporangium sp. NPDC006013]|uniref:hypothetical protein n=1 Tax=Streptosporangium sp. NPDC006013 TaxID=3155596 RepID=UPI0033B03593
MIRLVQAALPARLSGKVIRWQPLLGALLAWPRDEPLTWKGAVWSLRVVAALVTPAVVFVLDDAAADVPASVPLLLVAGLAVLIRMSRDPARR